MRQRSESASSLPSTRGELTTHENVSETGSDIVFVSHSPVAKQQAMSGGQSPVGRQQTSGSQSPAGRQQTSGSQSPAGRQQGVSGRVSSASSSTQDSVKHVGTCSDGQNKNDSVELSDIQIQDDVADISTTSISSLEDIRGTAEIAGGSCADDGGKVSPNLPSAAHTGSNQQSPVAADMTRLSLVDSPKVCIKDGVPYAPSPVPGRAPEVESGHLAAPPSAPRPSPPTSSSLSPPETKSPPPVSSAPITPPVSPPPPPSDPLTEGKTVTEPKGEVGWGKWAELPRGKPVEVEVTWAPSPINFTVSGSTVSGACTCTYMYTVHCSVSVLCESPALLFTMYSCTLSLRTLLVEHQMCPIEGHIKEDNTLFVPHVYVYMYIYPNSIHRRAYN